ncbi:MAG TPA: riboflavin synthase [Phycisphaerae bacterium]|nr:riboflavin synthase [Phycisphaerae bacterium]
MFTGLVQALGIVLAASDTPSGKRLTVSLAELADSKIEPGDSVCVSGVCLTVVKIANGNLQFDVISETLNRSTLGQKKPQDRVNLELSLRPDSYVGGHFVQGHVDGIATVAAVKQDPRDWRITFQVAPDLMPYIVPKGSIAVDGTSMTIAEVSTQASTFTLAVIPTTLEQTTLSGLHAGDQVNVETDILARTVVHWLTQMNAGQAKGAKGAAGIGGGITLAKLQELGMT